LATIIWFATIVVSYSYYRLYHFTLIAEANSTAQHFVDLHKINLHTESSISIVMSYAMTKKDMVTHL